MAINEDERIFGTHEIQDILHSIDLIRLTAKQVEEMHIFLFGIKTLPDSGIYKKVLMLETELEMCKAMLAKMREDELTKAATNKAYKAVFVILGAGVWAMIQLLLKSLIK